MAPSTLEFAANQLGVAAVDADDYDDGVVADPAGENIKCLSFDLNRARVPNSRQLIFVFQLFSLAPAARSPARPATACPST